MSARHVVWLVCAAYALSFLACYPHTLTNDDESHYLRQARLLLEGRSEITRIDPLSGVEESFAPVSYPIGTAVLMAPLVALGGWRASFMVPFLSLLLSVLVLARWLEDEGRSPLFALLVMGFPPALVMGRIAMSDVPSLAVVTVGLWLFWRGIEGGHGWWLASGFLAGASWILRESNPIPFVPFFAGAVLRGERKTWALVVGGLAGLSLRVIENLSLYGEFLHFKAGYHLALSSVPERLPLYLLAVLVFVPGGFVLSLLYRGRRWPELCIAVVGFVSVYLIQRYYTYETSELKRLITTPRYLLPIVPVMAFGMAESVPRLWRAGLERASPTAHASLETWAPRLIGLWVGGILLASVAVHPAFHVWSSTQAEIRDALAKNIDDDAVLITNYMATQKFLDEMDRKYTTLDQRNMEPEKVEQLADRYGEVYVAFLDRSDSKFWRRNMQDTAAFLAAIDRRREVVFDERMTPTDRLRIWRVQRALP